MPVTAPTPPKLAAGLARIEAASAGLGRIRQQWRGEAPAAYLAPASRDALDKRLTRLGVNFPRLAVSTLADRLTLTGLGRKDDDGAGAGRVWSAFIEAGGRELAELVHTDRLLYGRAYLTVWADEAGRPTLTGDSPFTMAHGADPATGETLWAVRRWTTHDGARAALYEADRITFWRNDSPDAGAGAGWKSSRAPVVNDLEAVPVIPFIRRQSLSDSVDGASAVEDVADLSDAVAKVLGDAMVTSEYYARPRRWATGLEIEEDDDGNPIDPFGTGRFLQSEAPDTKFGQLDPARLDGYADLLATLTQQIGAVTGLPPHYLGLHGDQPANADSIRASEAQLTMRAYTEQRQLDRPWQQVGWLLGAVLEQRPADPAELAAWSGTWESPELRTPAQAADAAVKLRSIGLPLETVLEQPLGYTPEEIARISAEARTQAVLDSLGRP